MTYIQIGIIYCTLALVLDLFILRTKVITKKLFWLSYVIVLFFQFVTNGVLTRFLIVRYNDFALIGGDYSNKVPPLIGDGRLFFAPVEDVFFGFSMILFTISIWLFLGKKNIQRKPFSGPPPKWWPKDHWYGTK
ncbi:MAG: lycopene cyclase domain-containing protein [Actinomycetes bacterium]